MECGIIDKHIEDWKNMGYDINDIRSNTPDCPFYLEPMYMLKERYAHYTDTNRRLKTAVGEINTQVQKHGEMYEVKEVVKVVDSKYDLFGILTFNVREVRTNVVKTVEVLLESENYGSPEVVREWRFKPGRPETPCPGSPSPPGSPPPLETPSPPSPRTLQVLEAKAMVEAMARYAPHLYVPNDCFESGDYFESDDKIESDAEF